MQLSFIDIVNYLVRISIIVIGLMFVTGAISPVPGEPDFTRYIGFVMIAFGSYRAVLYFIKTRRKTEL